MSFEPDMSYESDNTASIGDMKIVAAASAKSEAEVPEWLHQDEAWAEIPKLYILRLKP